MMVMAMCVSAFAAEGDTSASGTSATVISAFQSGFQKMASDAMSMIAIIAVNLYIFILIAFLN